ncbi:MAG TPA: tRNA (adenosine(37)-N6)-dimethylallyltransferase MiaA [Bacteroidia bacterium]|nr:tRNA (adenosine(37)-N6)-dimethylallyltransferase MiaA [Bacteroidia bacterium]
MQKHLLIICGPTAVGKTALSVQLAKYYNTEVISADSRQLYKEMSIGTAKPTVQEMEGVPHHFIDCISVQQNYNAGDYEKEVIKKLDELFTRHDIVVMCGGTGLYIDAVCKGFDEGIESNAEIKKQITGQYNLHGLSWLQNEVNKKDPDFYKQADINNPQRLMRALEVCLVTGKPYSSFRKNNVAERNFNVIKIFINEDREVLYDKINRRVHIMMQHGLLKEAENLYPYKNLNALNTVGYKELFDYFDNKISLNKAVDLIKQHTRNYAKRQVTWFKNDEDCIQFAPNEMEKIKAFVEIVLQHG